jgi:hypothetical protein
MKSRSLVRRRLVPVAVEGPPPGIGAPLTIGAETAGELRAISDGIGLALVRIDLLDRAMREGSSFEAGGARLHPREAP